MAITYTWSVKDLHKVTGTGAVYKVEWSCSGVDADTEGSHSRSGSYLHTETVIVETVDVAEVTETRNIITGETGEDADGNQATYVTETVTRVLNPASTTPAYTKIVPATPDHTASGFTAYADLTEADVLVWCKAGGVGAENEALITSNITNKIAAAANSTGVPW